MSKGQVFSLDFLIAIFLIILAIGFILQFYEFSVYNLKEEDERIELHRIGSLASNLLVSSPFIVCELTSNDESTIISFLKNCLSIKSGANPDPSWNPSISWNLSNKYAGEIAKAYIGIPENFACKIEIDAPEISGNWHIDTDCVESYTPIPENKSVFSIKRKIVIYQDNDTFKVKKSDFEDCINDSLDCKLVEGTITLWVWKE
jgi:hypothetical protein